MKISMRAMAVCGLTLCCLAFGCGDEAEEGTTQPTVDEENGTEPASPGDLGISDIELQYNNITGPDVATDCVDGVCTMPSSYHFGMVCPGEQSSLSLVIRNTALCADLEADDACEYCALHLGDDGVGDVGIVFAPGTNESAAFSLVEPSSTTLAPASDACEATNEVEVVVSFSPTDAMSDTSSVLVIHSNDPDEATIELPFTGAVLTDGPTATARIRMCGELDVNGHVMFDDCHFGDEIHQGGRIYVDGIESFDSSGDPANIVSYHWELIEHPGDNNVEDFDLMMMADGMMSFWPPIAGDYVARLTVTNDLGLPSCPTESSDLLISVVGP